MADETTPLLQPNGGKTAGEKGKYVVLRLLLAAFLISLSIAFTQVPILYVFRVMTCEEYYKTHAPFDRSGDRCSVNAIEAETARSVMLLGLSTTIFGVLNLLYSGFLIKRFGVKAALTQQTLWPVLRLCVQVVSVKVGAGEGVWIMQASQIVCILGGPVGYQLVMNAFVQEVVEPSQRTAAFGKLQGAIMIGSALGFLLGGLVGDAFGIVSPFQVALGLMLTSMLYTILFLPYVEPEKATESGGASKDGQTSKLGLLKMLAPQRWITPSGHIKTFYNVPLLALGVFLGVLATGYITVLLQLYATNIFSFGTSKNGWLMFLNLLTRGVFLMFAFPGIIAAGRKWMAGSLVGAASTASTSTTTEQSALLRAEEDLEIAAAPEAEGQPVEPPKPAKPEEGSAFDLYFLKRSLVVDGVMTALAFFIAHSWQMYIVAFLLPLASGSASAAKSVMVEMCPAAMRTDALQAITLVEMTAMMSTISLFGVIFSALAMVGKINLVFLINAGVAVLAVAVLAFCQFPPDGSVRVGEEPKDEVEVVAEERESQQQDSK